MLDKDTLGIVLQMKRIRQRPFPRDARFIKDILDNPSNLLDGDEHRLSQALVRYIELFTDTKKLLTRRFLTQLVCDGNFHFVNALIKRGLTELE